ncbi:hypothetical protein A9267_21070 [Shewanella sp. UCD-FRSSP16_17]|uniref:hypothetical protein n=1 Tax=Shewanella sp. UCD-FRSSP16_17 TaxID=1853256 RepID=UPI0007EEB25C|nr:hypothetical protein [Shewanella sp. UCD-FRSSP16_17]OBT09347.1 hypothetical protein A9267_21070 [Shewanella sp. UCD-FRSSP16_17]
MAKFFNKYDNGAISLGELVKQLQSKGDKLFSDEDFIISLLSKIYNNREFLCDVLFEQLDNLTNFQSDNPYTPQAFILSSTKVYTLRAAIWSPVSRISDSKDDVYFYDKAHDHNFTFYTVGYKGPGYETDLYTYESNDLNVGDEIKLDSLGILNLKEGDIWKYEKSKDVHSQYPPKEASISINLIDNNIGLRQYYFNSKTGKVLNRVSNKYDTLKVLSDLIGNKDTNKLIEEKIKTSSNQLIKDAFDV